ncbi:sensor histidine kinase [Caldimonas thermodepolymerans]|uniref:sensor histidine kinase n=1 Tax=Caldimonas thermodepolymerans TaxID=215580 RepID=UPI002492BDD2|nr:histidine kinase [Caldimonas thermodepolymerans]
MPPPGMPVRKARPAPPTSQFGTTTIFDHAVARPPATVSSPFDACRVGVVLRAVLFVHAVVAVAVSFVVHDLDDWLLTFAYGAGVALPATLAWLVVACALKKPLARLSEPVQWLVAAGLGAACAAYGWWQVGLLGLPFSHQVSQGAPLLAGTALAAALFYALRLRSRSELPAVTQARLTELQARIRPHFLFNTLNTAIALVRIDPARAEAVLEDLSELFRVALIESGSAVTLDEEIDLAQRYLAIEQIRFGERLKVTWELDDAAGGARVPPLLLQPLVENAVRHGIEPSPEGGWVRVRTTVRRGQAIISVTNSLPAAPAAGARGHGMALRNVKERLRLMHDVSAHFASGPERGTWRVQIAVPLA